MQHLMLDKINNIWHVSLSTTMA